MSKHPQHPSIVIRAARGSDTEALARLASLDSAPALHGPVLVAEADGRLDAALELESGARISDPFHPTSDLVALLELRARRLSTEMHPAFRRVVAERLGLGGPRARAA